jgi:hypothetical protein
LATSGTAPSRAYHTPGVYDAAADRVYFYTNRYDDQDEILELWRFRLAPRRRHGP